MSLTIDFKTILLRDHSLFLKIIYPASKKVNLPFPFFLWWYVSLNSNLPQRDALFFSLGFSHISEEVYMLITCLLFLINLCFTKEVSGENSDRYWKILFPLRIIYSSPQSTHSFVNLLCNLYLLIEKWNAIPFLLITKS